MDNKLNELTNNILIFKKGFNYSQDGPGNRLVYHMQGCSFRCKWCANPESMDFPGEQSTSYSVRELIDEAKRCRPMFFNNGGVTLTGGEPTFQFEAALSLLSGLKAEGIHTAIETNASHPRFAEILPYIDFPIVDFKHFDEEKHLFFTGHSLEQTKKNICMLSETGKKVLIRTPLINGVNTEPEGFAEFFSALDCRNFSFEFLPYHEFGKNKWTKKYEIKDGFITNDTLEHFKDVYKTHGLNIINT